MMKTVLPFLQYSQILVIALCVSIFPLCGMNRSNKTIDVSRRFGPIDRKLNLLYIKRHGMQAVMQEFENGFQYRNACVSTETFLQSPSRMEDLFLLPPYLTMQISFDIDKRGGNRIERRLIRAIKQTYKKPLGDIRKLDNNTICEKKEKNGKTVYTCTLQVRDPLPKII